MLNGSLLSLSLLLPQLLQESVELELEVAEVDDVDDVDEVPLVEDVLSVDELELASDGAFFSRSVR